MTVSRELHSQRLGRFTYTRQAYDSAALHGENTVGILRPTAVHDVRGSIYFMHGGDGTDEQWVQAGLEGCIGDAVMTALIERGIQIVLPNIGLSFLRAPDNAATPSHWAALTGEVMPLVESGTTTVASNRWITGISMGGFAALSAFLRQPGSFAGCGVHFPGIVDFDPFSDTALRAYAKRTGISDMYRDILAGCFRGAFTSASEYARHDPFAIAHSADTAVLHGKRMCLDVGSADDFGLQAGVTRFAAVCAERGIACDAQVIPDGRHDAAFLHARHDGLLHSLLLR